MNKWYKTLSIYALIFLFVIVMAYFFMDSQSEQEIKEVEFSEFVTELRNENVEELTLQETDMQGTLKNGDIIHAYAPSSLQLMVINNDLVMPQVYDGKLVVTSEPPKTTPWYVSMLPYLLTIVIFVVIWMVFMNSSQGGAGKAMSFGKSRARMYKSDGKKVTFSDVAGLEEEKEELQEIVDFLRRPKKYTALGARIPKGVLLVGPPGTGKTFVTKAVSGEAGVPFFSISGSDFVEMFVGVGASRVRDLFEQAKKNSPSIIFIDEGVIVFAATNRPDVLDPALLRPGRFDRQIVIGLPDVRGREAVLSVHAKNKPMDETVDLSVLAKMTPGFSPADLENVLNEAALLTARRDGKTIMMEELEEAVTKVMAGPAKKSRVVTEKERKLTAYHEAGHAVLIRNLPNSDPVHQVTIIPRGMAGGMTMFLPQEDRSYESQNHMMESLVHLLGGRAAEALVLDDISTGASNDIERATAIARDMVTKYGMSKRIGTVNYSDSGEVFIGNDFTSKRAAYSEATATAIDEEVKRLLDDAYEKAIKLLEENIDKLTLVAETLLDIETLDADQFESLYTGEKTREEIVSAARSRADEKAEKIARQKEEAAKEYAAEKAAAEQEQENTLHLRFENMKAENIVFENKKKHDAQAEEKFANDATEGEKSDRTSKENESDKQ